MVGNRLVRSHWVRGHSLDLRSRTRLNPRVPQRGVSLEEKRTEKVETIRRDDGGSSTGVPVLRRGGDFQSGMGRP